MSVITREVVVTPPVKEEAENKSFYPPAARETPYQAPIPPDQAESHYYDVPMLKPPTWKWQIASYFFLGGLSAGAYLVSRIADRVGGERYKGITRLGTAVAAGSFIPCTPLLIWDLGDMKRFHHMLRVLKPESPMSVGSWALTSYGGMLTLSVIREWLDGRGGRIGSLIGGIADTIGVPTAMVMAGYTGVLTNTSNTPVWARNSWLGALYSASALHNGAEAVELAMLTKSRKYGAGVRGEDAIEPVSKLNNATRIAEAVGLAGYLATAGKRAKPLTTGKYAPLLWAGAVGAGIVAPQILSKVAENRPHETKKALKITGTALGLLGSLALRWAIVYAGHQSAKDQRAAREMTKTPEKENA